MITKCFKFYSSIKHIYKYNLTAGRIKNEKLTIETGLDCGFFSVEVFAL
jgi:hypothetical protein